MKTLALCLCITDPVEPWQEVFKNLDEYLVSPKTTLLVLDSSSNHALGLKLRESFPYLKWVQVPQPGDAATLWQRYQYLLQGDVVVWMQQPVLLAPGHLETCLEALENQPDCVVLPSLVNLKKQRAIWPKLPAKSRSYGRSFSKLKNLQPLLCVFFKNRCHEIQASFWSLFTRSGQVTVFHPETLQIPVP